MRDFARSAIVLLAIMALVMAGCTTDPAADSQAALPTLAQLPTSTVTNTPTQTFTPSNTPTATFTPDLTGTAVAVNRAAVMALRAQTATQFAVAQNLTLTRLAMSDTPSPTHTFTPVPTETITPTFTPSLTLTPRPTETLAPTFTPSRTPLPTFTPTVTPSRTRPPTRTPLPTLTLTPLPTATLTPTSLAPIIFSFGSNIGSTTPNGQVTFAFSSQADGGRVELLNQQGGVAQVFPVLPVGNLTVSVPDGLGRLVTYRFVAVRAGLEASRTVQIGITCPVSWFFGDAIAPPNAACPLALPLIGDGRFQVFERGIMLYVNANGLNQIYGLQDDGSRYIAYTNGWDGATINSAPPPEGRFIPAQMFNWAYYNTLAPIGSWAGSLGWGVIDIDTSQRTIQWEGQANGSGAFYIDAPNGAVYRFSGGSAGSWGRLR